MESYLETKDLGIPDMNFHYAYPGFRVWGTADMTSWSLERMGGKLGAIIVELFT